jgi:hypothetical protein
MKTNLEIRDLGHGDFCNICKHACGGCNPVTCGNCSEDDRYTYMCEQVADKSQRENALRNAGATSSADVLGRM